MKEAGVKCAVAESGISSAEDIKRVARVGADAFLIGTSLMKAEDPYRKLRELMENFESQTS
jgi:indole-3-glycerol phosphate synthase